MINCRGECAIKDSYEYKRYVYMHVHVVIKTLATIMCGLTTPWPLHMITLSCSVHYFNRSNSCLVYIYKPLIFWTERKGGRIAQRDLCIKLKWLSWITKPQSNTPFMPVYHTYLYKLNAKHSRKTISTQWRLVTLASERALHLMHSSL